LQRERTAEIAITTVLFVEHERAKRLRDRRLSKETRRWRASPRLHGLCVAYRQECEGREPKYLWERPKNSRRHRQAQTPARRRFARNLAVVEATRPFVCFKASREDDAELWDRFRIDAVPRSIILTADGASLSELHGYHPPDDYLAWLTGDRAKETQPDELSATPRPVGPDPADADYTSWFLDERGSRKRLRVRIFTDGDCTW